LLQKQSVVAVAFVGLPRILPVKILEKVLILQHHFADAIKITTNLTIVQVDIRSHLLLFVDNSVVSD